MAVRVWMILELSGHGATYSGGSELCAAVLNELDERILAVRLSERKGGAGINLYAEKIPEYP